MSISIVLYSVAAAEHFNDLQGVSRQMKKERSVNLYKITEDLSVIFLNNPEPWEQTDTIPYKMLFGTSVEQPVEFGTIGGFLSTSEVVIICKWIRENKLDSFEGFVKMYDNTSEEVKLYLEEIAADSKEELYNGYVKPLTDFYMSALEGKNAVVICGE